MGVAKTTKERVEKCLMTQALVIFAKAPIAGQVKTRLCPPLTLEQAAELYEGFLIDTVSRACSLAEVRVFLAITPADSEPIFRTLLPFPVSYFPQRGATLGEREANVFADLFNVGFARVVMIGSDIPTMPTSHLRGAFSLLAEPQNDVVLGPSRDGGYYLLGTRALHPELFENITWSTSVVFEETQRQARRTGLRVAQVPPWYDVDSEEELQQLVEELTQPGNAVRAPRTRECLMRLGLISQRL
jgi:uncharacterized protein